MTNFLENITVLEIYLICISIFSFFIYGYDKLKALSNSRDTRRISEKTLLLSSFIGGTIGSLLAMFFFRHKVKKVSFILKLASIIVIQFLVIYYLILPSVSV